MTQPESASSGERAMSSLRRKALALLASPNFFRHCLSSVKKAGLIGEEGNALVVFVVTVSRLLSNPLHLFIKGRSSSGKNFLAQKVLSLVPKSSISEISSTTHRAWNYLGKKLVHKVVYVQEVDDSSGTVHPSRLLISENQLIRLVTVRKKGKLVTQRHVTKGPVACISTTTRNQLQVDDETRRVSVWMDESPEQTKRIAKASLEGSTSEGLSNEELEIWHEVQLALSERAKLPVEIPPWFGRLSDFLLTEDVRCRRYVPAFVQACKTVCLIRSFRRDEKEVRARGKLSINFIDFAVTTLIFNTAFSESLGLEKDQNRQTCDVVRRLSSGKGGRPVDALDLARALGISQDHAYAQLRRAAAAGIVRQANPPVPSNHKLYLPTPHCHFLPDPAVVFQKVDCGASRVKFIHPLSGKLVTYSRCSRG